MLPEPGEICVTGGAFWMDHPQLKYEMLALACDRYEPGDRQWLVCAYPD